jgi:hypothetical protein
MTTKAHEDMMQLEKQKSTEQLSELLLWCSVIAGICSYTTPDIRAWFIAEARGYCGELSIVAWDEFLEFMQSFSWLDSASGQAGRAFWNEIGLCEG